VVLPDQSLPWEEAKMEECSLQNVRVNALLPMQILKKLHQDVALSIASDLKNDVEAQLARNRVLRPPQFCTHRFERER
jgi:hypothetical protein